MKIRKMTKAQVYEEMKRLISARQHGSKRFDHLMQKFSGGKMDFVYHFGAVKFTRQDFLVLPPLSRTEKANLQKGSVVASV